MNFVDCVAGGQRCQERFNCQLDSETWFHYVSLCLTGWLVDPWAAWWWVHVKHTQDYDPQQRSKQGSPITPNSRNNCKFLRLSSVLWRIWSSPIGPESIEEVKLSTVLSWTMLEASPPKSFSLRKASSIVQRNANLTMGRVLWGKPLCEVVLTLKQTRNGIPLEFASKKTKSGTWELW